MVVMPAIDLRGGACVQLVGGSYANERVRLPDPLAAAAHWRDAGFRQLHVVDLDAATGRGSNRDIVSRLVGDPVVDVQVGGGLRSDEAVDELLRIGARRAVVGTRALEDPDWIARLAARLPRRIVVAVDVRGRTPVVRGWAVAAPRRLDDILRQLAGLPLAGVLVTAVHVEGRMAGPDLQLVEWVLSRVSVPVIASGGIATLHDLRALRELGVSAAVMGMALYDGAPDVSRIALEFAQ